MYFFKIRRIIRPHYHSLPTVHISLFWVKPCLAEIKTATINAKTINTSSKHVLTQTPPLQNTQTQTKDSTHTKQKITQTFAPIYLLPMSELRTDFSEPNNALESG